MNPILRRIYPVHTSNPISVRIILTLSSIYSYGFQVVSDMLEGLGRLK